MALRINKDTHFVDATMVDGTCDCVLFQGTVIKAGAWRDESNLKEIKIGDGADQGGSSRVGEDYPQWSLCRLHGP